MSELENKKGIYVYKQLKNLVNKGLLYSDKRVLFLKELSNLLELYENLYNNNKPPIDKK